MARFGVVWFGSVWPGLAWLGSASKSCKVYVFYENVRSFQYSMLRDIEEGERSCPFLLRGWRPFLLTSRPFLLGFGPSFWGVGPALPSQALALPSRLPSQLLALPLGLVWPFLLGFGPFLLWVWPFLLTCWGLALPPLGPKGYLTNDNSSQVVISSGLFSHIQRF